MESGVFACLQGVCSQGLQVPSPCAAALRQGLGLSEGEKGAQVCNMAGGTVPGGEVRQGDLLLVWQSCPLQKLCRAGLAAKKCKRKGRSEVTLASLYAGTRVCANKEGVSLRSLIGKKGRLSTNPGVTGKNGVRGSFRAP